VDTTLPAIAATDGAVLDLDRLDAYRVAVEFAALAARLRVTPASLRDQLDRASASIVLNIAEGAGRPSAADRAHFYAIARGSAFECAGVLDVLHARGALATSAHVDARTLIVRIVQMLSRMTLRHPAALAPRARA
jgi:four helix bundle protein